MRKKLCPVAGCNVRLSRSHDIVRDTALEAQLRAVPSAVSEVRVRGSEVRWDNSASIRSVDADGGEPSAKRPRTEISLADGEAAVVVDENRRLWWAQQLTRVKTEL